jgi:hypothetical protein
VPFRNETIAKTVGNNMKRRTRIIIGIAFMSLALLSTFHFLPKESELYLESDISDFQNSIFPISILLSIVLAFLIVFDKSEYTGGKWSKIVYIGYIGMMSYLIFSMTSDLLTTFTLKINRISTTQTLNKNFEITHNLYTSNNKTDTIAWINHSEYKHIIHGRISDRHYEDGVDRVITNDIEYSRIAKKELKKEFNIKLKKGLLGILFDPKISE